MPVKVDESHDGDDIVVTGISGSFPQSDDIEEFKNNLFNGKDMITSVQEWDRSGAFRRMGAIKQSDRFDHEFFHMDSHMVEGIPANTRLHFEKIFEAITDAGYNLKQLKRKRIAVVCGESDSLANENLVLKNYDGKEIHKQCRFKGANLISYWFNFNGPSITVDSACSGSIIALDYAVKAIRNGDCDGALIASSNLCRLPNDEYFEIGILSPSGICRPFDAEGDGFTRAETAVAVFLQKRKDARRIYATVINSKSNSDGFKKEGVTFPSVRQQKQLFASFYKEINISPLLLSYIEAHGTGTKAGDVVEGTSVEAFFCANRETPLKIGSVKSNMGHGEAAAGLCSLAKMIISFEEGMLPANLNFANPNPKIKGLHNGKLEVITKATPVKGAYFGINSFGVGGANAHVLISPHNKIKKGNDILLNDGLPRLVTVAGRTEEAVDCLLREIMKNHTDFEYIRLIHEIFSENTEGFPHRGYVILKQTGNHKTSKKFIVDEKKRPLWFVFSGKSSQWPAMGVSLMKIPIFAESVYKSHKILDSKGVNLMKIITSNEPQIISNVLNSYVGIVAIQIALIDVMKALGIEPDGIIGHSIGEIACAYADECLTAEQTILIAYYYGLVALEAEFIHSTMIVIDKGYNVMKTLTPSEIDIMSHDGPDCCTISGPTEIIQRFIEDLNVKNLSILEVHTSNIAYHSRFIPSATSKLVPQFKKIIPKPKPRSKKWLCTSALQHYWSADELKYCSAQYFANNFFSPVYFEESYSLVPKDAVAIEIGPQGYLTNTLKCLPPSSEENITLTTKYRKNDIEFFMNSLGRIYETGYATHLSKLYPLIEFPVSKATPMISPSIKWNHKKQWQEEKINDKNSESTVQDVIINPNLSSHEYITGHVIDERNLYPGLGYLELIWTTVAKMQQKKVDTLPIVFENIRFERATNVPKKGLIKFRITIHLGTNTFEVAENQMLVASGNVRIPKNIKKEVINVKPFQDDISNSEILPLNTKDFYKELRLKGYHYKGMFKKVVSANAEGTYGRVLWGNNFTSFMDTMAQVAALKADCRELLVPTYIRKVVIDIDKHYKILETLDKQNPEFPVNYYASLDLLTSGGVQIMGFGTNEIARRPDKADPVLEIQKFIPYISEEEMDITLAIRLCVHIALENASTIKVITYELLNQEYTREAASISHTIAQSLKDLPLIQAAVNVLTKASIPSEDDLPQGINLSNDELPDDNSGLLIVLSDIENKTQINEKIFKALKKDGFIITRKSRSNEKSLKDLGFEICFRRRINDDEEILLLKIIEEAKQNTTVIRIENDLYSWIPEIQTALTNITLENNKELIVYSEREQMSGILGFFNCLKNEENGKSIRCFFIADDTAPNFSQDILFYKSQLDKHLSQNVFKNGQWGSYRHLPFEPIKEIEVTSSFCMIEKRADFSSFRWVEDSLKPNMYKNKSNSKNLIHVYYSSLNFKDVLLAVGRISMSSLKSLYSRLNECYLGFEFSGKDENGRRIMGMVNNKAIATTVEVDSNATWVVPDHLSLEEAASIPGIYLTVVHALLFRIKLKKGASILIHAGSGGIGQAAINICLHYGCNIFTTVGTPEKVEFIKQTYPQIPENHICNSRDTSFESVIMELTNGRGVDIVLNSLSEEKLKASLRCVAKGGNFLEIGKFDMTRNNCIEMGQLLKNITFHSIQLDLSKRNKGGQFDKIRNKLQEMLNEGIIKPIKRTIFQTSEVESAFRYMAAGKHIGKVIIKIRDEEENLCIKPTTLVMKAKPRVLCEGKKSYVIVGGLGGFGLELADWLILRGARNIVLSSRTGIKNGYQSYRIKLWRSYGVNVVIFTDDVTEEEGTKKLLAMTNALGPVAGIFNVAVVLKDDPFQKQTAESFKTVAASKAIATTHLDKLSREMCPHLEYFVVFSSVVCGRGNKDQTNYGFSNSVMERICESRNVDNLPALAIQWGAIGEVGVVADFAENNLSIVIGGTLQQNVRSCLNSLNTFMKQPNPIVASMIVAEKRHTGSDIINTLANILGIKDLKTISLTWTFPELGMDSIMAVEIKQILESEFNTFFTPEDLRTMTFAKLYKLKQENKNSTESGEKMKSPYLKLLMDAKLNEEPFLHIPLNEAQVKKPQDHDTKTLFMLPGVEGMASFMEPLAKNLHSQAICFQYHRDELPINCLRKMGEYFVEFITDKLGPDQEFFVVAYSMGTVYALEVVRILEEKGRKGHLYLIEGSPQYIKQRVVDYCKKKKILMNEETLQNHTCIQALKILFPDKVSEEYISYIEKANGWESKKKLICSITATLSIYEKIINDMLDRLYAFSNVSSNYELNYEMLDTPCTLIRVANDENDLDNSYGLTEYFKNPVQVYRIEATHFTIIEHPETAEIIRNCPLWKTHD